jgi:hypothetical protein
MYLEKNTPGNCQRVLNEGLKNEKRFLPEILTKAYLKMVTLPVLTNSSPPVHIPLREYIYTPASTGTPL